MTELNREQLVERIKKDMIDLYNIDSEDGFCLSLKSEIDKSSVTMHQTIGGTKIPIFPPIRCEIEMIKTKQETL